MTTGRYEQMLIAIQHKGYIDAQEARELMHHQDLVKQSTLETIECGACGHRDVYIYIRHQIEYDVSSVMNLIGLKWV